MKTCEIEDCENRHLARGLCREHYDKTHRVEYKRQRYQKSEIRIRRIEYLIQWRKDNPNWQQDKKNHRIEKQKQWRADNKEHLVEYHKQWWKTPIGKIMAKAYNHNRRNLTKSLTKEIVQRVYEDNIKKYGTLTCVLCFKPVEFKDSSLEHSTPISRGGSNLYENLGVAHYICNCKKHTLTLKEWLTKEFKL